MDFLDDANLFGGGLEGLADDGFAQQGPVSLVDELNLSADFEPLQVEPLHHVPETQTPEKPNFEQLQTFDSIKLHQLNQPFNLVGTSNESSVLSPHSQFHCSPDHQNQTNGLFPSAHNENSAQSFVDGSPMWGHQSPISNQNGSPFHSLQGHSQSVQQMTPFLTHHDFALHQSNPQQQQPASVQPQQAINHFTTGQKTLNQGSQFMGVHGSASPHMNLIGQPTTTVSSSIQHPVTVQQFNQPATTANPLHPIRFTSSASHGGVPQNVSFSSSSREMTTCSINNTNQFTPQYPYPNNNLANGNNLTSTTILSTHQAAQGMTCFPGSDAFTVPAGSNQESVHHMLSPNSSAKQKVLQPMHSVHTQGNFSPSSIPSVPTDVPITTSSVSKVKISIASTQGKPVGISSLQGNQFPQRQTHPLTRMDTDDVFQDQLLTSFGNSGQGQRDLIPVPRPMVSQQVKHHSNMQQQEMVIQHQLHQEPAAASCVPSQHWQASITNQHLPTKGSMQLTLQRQPPSSQTTVDGSSPQAKQIIKSQNAQLMTGNKQKKKEMQNKQELSLIHI